MSDRKKLQAFELWCWRRLLRISWKEKVPNTQVLKIVNNPTPLDAIILRRKLVYFGHITRHESMEQDLMLNMVEGKRSRGRCGLAG